MDSEDNVMTTDDEVTTTSDEVSDIDTSKGVHLTKNTPRPQQDLGVMALVSIMELATDSSSSKDTKLPSKTHPGTKSGYS
jgi:hypothetical protein